MKILVEQIANVFRGDLVESVHYGQIAIVDQTGELLSRIGDIKHYTYWRSAAKPFQVLPVIFSGAAEKFGFTEPELAVMAASHNGEEEHVKTVNSILDKIGLDETALLCGIHPPVHEPSARRLYQEGKNPRTLHHNCSGKHAGLLAICRYYGWDIGTYNKLEHPVQQLLLEMIAELTEMPAEKITPGYDGCGVVVFGLPIEKMALAYARLANPESLPDKYRDACQLVTTSMENNPYLVGGTDRFNTDLLKVTGSKLVAKNGGEGVFCVGVHGKMGITMKVTDGNSRAIPPVMVEILSQLNLLTDKELTQLAKYHHPEVLNDLKIKVGTIEPVVSIN